ncbi:hypothetical protein SLEP1_g56350 [Rubroshorea leprosula]|uniref:Uncharacterized protein n=1 Tax=Rubroshorea leprosula TaxID=152421 RepID=A0AAV5MJC5_9ROSI|nr:hypothetical protein SLEP1_g56350 [Rubroshorea leprosula]
MNNLYSTTVYISPEINYSGLWLFGRSALGSNEPRRWVPTNPGVGSNEPRRGFDVTQCFLWVLLFDDDEELKM